MSNELQQALTALEAAAEAIKKLQTQQQPEPQLSIKGAWYEVVSVDGIDNYASVKIGDIVQCIQDNDDTPYCLLNGNETSPNGSRYTFYMHQLRHLPNYVHPVEYITDVSKLPTTPCAEKVDAYLNILHIVAYCNSQFESDGKSYVFDGDLDIIASIAPKRYVYHFTSRKAIELAKNTPDFMKQFEVWM